MIGKIRIALNKANAPNADISDINDALLDLFCVDRLGKNGIVQENLVFSELEEEINAFIDTLISLRKSKRKLPSIEEDIIKFHCDFLSTRLHELPPLYLKIDFGSIDISSQD
ncbi:MAG: hypothetical protein K2I95_09250 [Treponemataceae bacterium]|nr:hypothetical protein [Treponemataceae bacterium]